jgi:hypothetical protein
MNTPHFSTLGAEVPAYAQLQREIHDALLQQNPDWILPNGECPSCDSYDARFAELLIQTLSTRARGPKRSTGQFRFQFQNQPRVSTTHLI